MARLTLLLTFVIVIVAVGALDWATQRPETIAQPQMAAVTQVGAAAVATPAHDCSVSGDLVGDGNPATIARALCK